MIANKNDTLRFSLYEDQNIKFDKIHSNFCPVRCDRYITICVDNKYKYWPEVIEIVMSALYLNKVAVIALSNKERGADLRTSLNINNIGVRHAAGLLDKSLYHFCAQDWSLTLAQNNGIKNCFFVMDGEKNDLFIKECGEFTEETGKPEVLAKKIVESLNINQEIFIDTKFIGPSYGPQVLEMIPDFNISDVPDIDPETRVGIRCDLVENWEFVLQATQLGLRPAIISKTLPTLPMAAFLGGVESINLYVDENTRAEDIKMVRSIGIKCKLLSNEGSNEIVKRNLFDLENINIIKNWGKNNLDILKEFEYDTMLRSKRLILSKDGTFLSVFHWKNGLPSSQKKGTLLLDAVESDEFLAEADLFYYYK